MKHVLLATALALFTGSIHAQEKIRLGWIAGVSGPLNLVGAEQRRGLDVALEHLGNRLGGIPNEQITEGIGAYMTQKGVKKLYLLGMDYEAGHEHSNAARKGYKGEVVAHVFTPINQVDFAADIAKIRASGADAVWAFYPGGPGIAFTRQWAQAGLQGKIPLYSNVALSE